MSEIKLADKTVRGFKVFEFDDSYNEKCTLQESSTVEPHIWLGMNKPDIKLFLPEIDKEKIGWVNYPLPECVHTFSRMHLGIDEVKDLINYLQYFVNNKSLPEQEIILDDECFKEYDNIKKITIGDYVRLYGCNDKTIINIFDSESLKILYTGRIDYLQYTSEGCMHDLCKLVIDHFGESDEIYVNTNNYTGRIGIY